MNYEVKISEYAVYDIERIQSYILFQFGSPQISQKISKEIFQKISSLKQFAESGQLIYGLNGESTNYRSIVCKNYIIVYRVRENIEGMRMNDETIVRIRRFKVATIKINMDDDIKRAADNLFSELGLDTSTAVKIFISAALEEEGLPFRVKKHRYNAETLEAMNDVRLHRNLKGPFNTAGEAMKAMLED